MRPIPHNDTDDADTEQEQDYEESFFDQLRFGDHIEWNGWVYEVADKGDTLNEHKGRHVALRVPTSEDLPPSMDSRTDVDINHEEIINWAHNDDSQTMRKVCHHDPSGSLVGKPDEAYAGGHSYCVPYTCEVCGDTFEFVYIAEGLFDPDTDEYIYTV